MSEKQGPTWYDILGVAPDASAEEIKAAWRNATDKFEPGSGTGQFRLFNEAADVLLDPAQRAAYDAELGLARTEERIEERTEEPAAAHLEEPAEEPAAEPGAEPAAERADVAPESPEPAATGRTAIAVDRLGASLPAVLLVCLPVLLIGVLAIAGSAAGFKIGGLRMDSVATRADARDWEAGTSAAAAASRALTAVLAYDYRHLEADRDRGAKFFTAAERKDYLKNFNLLIKAKDGQVGPAVKTKTVVTAEVLSTAVEDASENRARIVVFVNQTAVKGGTGSPSIFQNRVVATMVHRDGDWLVDKITSY